MGENKLTNLAIISIERELSNALALDDVVTEFAGLIITGELYWYNYMHVYVFCMFLKCFLYV